MLDRITPLLITANEVTNIERTLAALDWAQEIVVVDSGSSDGTLDLLRSNRRVHVVERKFDSAARQLQFGLKHAGVSTDWVLALDADHVLTPAIIDEMGNLEPEPETSGYRAGFIYCIRGQRLRGSLYPPRIVLFRKDRGGFKDDGHTQRILVEGTSGDLKGKILHDDRKPIARWLASQTRYSRLEAAKLEATPPSRLTMVNRIRRLGFLAPLLVLPYCLFLKGCILDGRAGWSYAFQRTIAEALLSVRVLERRLTTETPDSELERGERH